MIANHKSIQGKISRNMLMLACCLFFIFLSTAWLSAQTLAIPGGGKYRQIAPDPIPVNTSGASDIGVLQLDIENTNLVTDAYIGEIVITLNGSDTLGTTDISNVKAYLNTEGKYKAPNPPLGNPGSFAIQTILKGVPTASDITLTITDSAALVPAWGANRALWIAFDYAVGTSTPNTVGYYINTVKYGDLAGETDNTFSPGALATTAAINTYSVTFDAQGDVQNATEDQGTSEVPVLKLTFGNGSDEAVIKEIQSITLQSLGQNDADVDLNGVSLHEDTNTNGTFDGAGADLSLASQSILGGTVTLSPVSGPSVQFSNIPKVYFIVVNISGTAVVDNTIGFQIADPSNDIVFADTVADAGPDVSGEYNQIGYITAGSPTPSTNHTFTITEYIPPDLTPPQVSTTIPAADALNVAANIIIQAVFNEDMDETTVIAGNFTLVDDVATPVAGSFNYNDGTNTLTFTPGVALDWFTKYTATISGLVTDQAGNPLSGGDYSWDFTTTIPIPPSVLTTIPVDTATGIAVSSVIIAVFSEDLDETTIDFLIPENSFSITPQGGGSAIDGSLSYLSVGFTLTFTPDSPLAYNTTFDVTISGAITDLDGLPLSDSYGGLDYNCSFTTAQQYPDFEEPTAINNKIMPGATPSVKIFVPQPPNTNPTDIVTIQIFTVTGQRVATLTKSNETYQQVLARLPIIWDGTNGRKEKLGPGLYFIQIKSADYKKILKVMIVR